MSGALLAAGGTNTLPFHPARTGPGVGRWMGGLTDRLVSHPIGQLVDWWVGQQVGICIYVWVDRWVGGCVDRRMSQWMESPCLPSFPPSTNTCPLLSPCFPVV